MSDSQNCWLEPGRTFPFFKGRVALYAILSAAGIGEGDEVILPGFTCVVVPAAIGYTKAKPVFCDIDPNNYNADPDLIISLISSKTRAVIVQHTFGVPAPIDRLKEICGDEQILLIEDCAHAVGSISGNTPVGMLGDASFCSFQWSKPVTTGLGGVARVNNDYLLNALKEAYETLYHEPGLLTSVGLLLLSEIYSRWYRPQAYWLTRSIYRKASSWGVVQGSSTDVELVDPSMPATYMRLYGRHREHQIPKALEKLDELSQHRCALARRYEEYFGMIGAHTQATLAGTIPVHLRYPILVDDRDRFLAEARAQRIEIGDWFNAPLHPLVSGAELFGYKPGACPTAEIIAKHMVNLPTHSRIDNMAFDDIMGFIDERRDMILSSPPSSSH